VDSCVTHFPTPVPHVERPTIVAISDESKTVVKTFDNYLRVTGKPAVIRRERRDEDWPPENLLISGEVTLAAD
jgi:hypothetical protein